MRIARLTKSDKNECCSSCGYKGKTDDLFKIQFDDCGTVLCRSCMNILKVFLESQLKKEAKR